jgi:hypothetical protein
MPCRARSPRAATTLPLRHLTPCCSRDPSIGLADACVGHSIVTGARRLKVAAGDAGVPGPCAPARCLTDCAGTGRRTPQVLALCTRALTCGDRTMHCLAPLLVFPFLNHAKSLRNDPWLMVLGFWTAWSFATLHCHCASVSATTVTTVCAGSTVYMITTLSAAASI